jgi:hypothetical protein
MTKKRKKPIDPFRQVNVDLPGLSLQTAYPLQGTTGLINDSLSPITRFDFDRCPICLSTDDLTDEHAPPEQAGGVVATKTCQPCNSLLGALVDVDLIDFLSSSTISRWSRDGSGLLGSRNAGRTLLHSTADGQFAILVSGPDRLRREFAQMMATGQASAEFRLPDLRRARIGGLKNAYVAACVQLQETPETESAERIRAELLAVRQCRRRRATLPATPIADNSVLMARIDGDLPLPGLNLGRFEVLPARDSDRLRWRAPGRMAVRRRDA